jgi:hypothetical protein
VWAVWISRTSRQLKQLEIYCRWYWWVGARWLLQCSAVDLLGWLLEVRKVAAAR